MTVTVLAFGSAADVLGWTERTMELRRASRLADLIDQLEAACPRLVEGRGRLKYAINEAYADVDAPLNPGDSVAIIPPVSGGAPSPLQCRLTREPIDVPALLDEVADPAGGAVGVFLGTVRLEHDADGRPLEALEYSAYEPMALRELERVVSEVAAAVPLLAARVVHRLGTLGIGAVSVAVVVATAHRAASFDACRQIIEQLKVRAPIFKRELWAGGARTWVDPDARD